MGFNRRKMEDQRGQAAEKEAAGQAHADAVLANDRRRYHSALTVWR
jgi:hypothetical protein